MSEGTQADQLVTPASLLPRLVARLIDTGICTGSAGLAVLAGADTESWVTLAGAVVLFLVYEAGLLVVLGATPGKLLFGLRVFGFDGGGQLSPGRAAARVALYTLIGAIPCGLGAVIMLVTAANDPSGWHRAWHDRGAGTVVVKMPERGLRRMRP